MKEVIALELGVYKDTRQRKNSRFFVEDVETADWYKPYKGEGVATPVTQRQTLAEFAESSRNADRISGGTQSVPTNKNKKIEKPETRNLDVLTK